MAKKKMKFKLTTATALIIAVVVLIIVIAFGTSGQTAKFAAPTFNLTGCKWTPIGAVNITSSSSGDGTKYVCPVGTNSWQQVFYTSSSPACAGYLVKTAIDSCKNPQARAIATGAGVNVVFCSPSDRGAHKICVCIDKNKDGDYSDPNEEGCSGQIKIL